MTGLVQGDEIRVGLIGFGYSTRTFHRPLLMATAGYRIAAVASSRPREVEAELPGVAIFADPVALTRHPELDLVVIATPNATHASLAEAGVRAGRHVVVDKPFTLTADEARHLTALARDRGTLLSVFQNRRWDSDFLTVQDALRRGLLGQVALCESRFDRFRPQIRDRWREGAGPGAGLLYDLGPHLIDQALVLFGPPESVQATLARQRPEAVSVDFAHLVLRNGERIVTLQAGSLVPGGSPRFSLHGDRASLIKRHPDVQEAQLRQGKRPGSAGWGVDPDDAVLYDGASGEPRTVKSIPGEQRRYYEAVREALHGRAANPVTPEQATTVMRVLEAALRSGAEHRRVVLEYADDERAAWP
ncbi:MAG TPA: oxidoreductase [Gemmatimonadales bacterium]|nr:oxidoreductase [Gemmatimonadales bacterium]